MEKLFVMKAGSSFKKCLVLLLMLLNLAVFTAFRPSQEAGGKLLVTVEGLRSNKGVVRITLFDQAEGFPQDSGKARKVVTATPKGNAAHIAFEQLPAGRYAVAILHDENENGKMDTNMVGYPKEGWGASTDNLPTFRAPRFEEAAFALKGPEHHLTVRIRY
jgi:uncharacterized protein (DUF2141 family)